MRPRGANSICDYIALPPSLACSSGFERRTWYAESCWNRTAQWRSHYDLQSCPSRDAGGPEPRCVIGCRIFRRGGQAGQPNPAWGGDARPLYLQSPRDLRTHRGCTHGQTWC
jgi:hypothetical protein